MFQWLINLLKSLFGRYPISVTLTSKALSWTIKTPSGRVDIKKRQFGRGGFGKGGFGV